MYKEGVVWRACQGSIRRLSSGIGYGSHMDIPIGWYVKPGSWHTDGRCCLFLGPQWTPCPCTYKRRVQIHLLTLWAYAACGQAELPLFTPLQQVHAPDPSAEI